MLSPSFQSLAVMICRMSVLRAAVAGTLIGAGALGAQVTTVDEGSFTITRNGQTVGREEFTIRSTPGARGAQFVARGTVSYTDRRLAPALSADSSGAPLYTDNNGEAEDVLRTRRTLQGAIVVRAAAAGPTGFVTSPPLTIEVL